MCGSSPPPPPADPPPPPPPPRLPKVPDADVFRKRNQFDQSTGFGKGYSGTLLTGPGGAPTPAVNLGAPTILGS